MKFKLLKIITSIAILSLINNANALENEKPTLIKSEKIVKNNSEILSKIEKYINNIKNLKARFMQVSSKGDQAEGDLYIKRPGKLRLAYDLPTPILLVSNGHHLIYYDLELDQVSYLALSQTPAGVILKENVSFNDPSIRVVNIRKAPNLIEISVVQNEDAMAGELTLSFSKDPFQLRQWKVKDAQGIETSIVLYNIKTDIDLDKRLFIFKDPRKKANR